MRGSSVDAAEAAARTNGPRDRRPVIAHAQLIDPADLHGGRLRTTVAPVTAALLPAGITVLICSRLDLFTSAGPAVNQMLIGLTPVVFATGAALALRIRRSRPDVYARLATTDVDSV